MSAPNEPLLRASASHPGAPLDATLDGMRDADARLGAGLGPGAWADRADVPDATIEGHPKVVPLRAAPNFFVEPRDPDPRGMTVVGADGVSAGVVRDVWVDRSEPQVRYLELAVADGGTVLVPMNCCRVQGRAGVVRVKAILGRQFAAVPRTRLPDQVTLLEEDKIMAYFAAGYLYASAERFGPIL